MLANYSKSLFAVFVLVLSPTAFGQSVAIEGYSPVSYFTKGIAERGDETYSVVHDGATYLFTSEEQRILFTSDPDKYKPRFGEYCPYSLQTGMRKAIDPTKFKVVGETLLLFHYSDELDARSEWNKGNDEQQMFKAGEEYVLFTF